tara:strand:- start:1384 stop:1788 length:405 start_codon:yes stop_codon:yes gene_type:complete
VSTLKVLVVDDSVGDFRLINISLEQAMGDEVSLDHALSVDAAAQMIRETDYDVIVHDLFLPPWGPEAITATYKIAPSTPIIAISGQSSPDLHRIAVANGAKLFCSKSDLGGGNIGSILAQVVPAFTNPASDANC